MNKINIFGKEIEWYDVKTKGKKLLRGFTYGWLIQELICLFIVFYMWLVYLSSKKKFINSEVFLQAAKAGKSLISTSWHNRLMMMPFVSYFTNQKANPNYKFIALASNHGDGRFVGRVMHKFGFKNIYGSSKNGRKASRGIDTHSLRELIRGLKDGMGLGITPDGPRGPNQKINGEIIAIAKISGAAIAPMSYSCSRFFSFNSWDNFKLPLPFSKICFYFGDLIFIDKSLSKDDEIEAKKELEKKLNEAQERSLFEVKNWHF